jgi:hypothetical protein
MNHCCLDFFRGIVAQSTDDVVPCLSLCRILLYSHYPHTLPLLPFTDIPHSYTFRICCPTIHDIYDTITQVRACMKFSSARTR